MTIDREALASHQTIDITTFGRRTGEARRRVFTSPHTSWYASQAELDHLVATAPMVEIHIA